MCSNKSTRQTRWLVKVLALRGAATPKVARAARLANADTFAATRRFPNGTYAYAVNGQRSRLTGMQPKLHEASGPLRLHGEHGIRYPKPEWESRTAPTHLHTRCGESRGALATDRQLSVSRSERLSSSFDPRILQDRPSINTSPVINLKRPPPEQLKQPYIMDTQVTKVSRANFGACGVQPRIP